MHKPRKKGKSIKVLTTKGEMMVPSSPGDGRGLMKGMRNYFLKLSQIQSRKAQGIRGRILSKKGGWWAPNPYQRWRKVFKENKCD